MDYKKELIGNTDQSKPLKALYTNKITFKSTLRDTGSPELIAFITGSFGRSVKRALLQSDLGEIKLMNC